MVSNACVLQKCGQGGEFIMSSPIDPFRSEHLEHLAHISDLTIQMSKLLHCEWVLDNKLLWILFLTNPLMMLTLYGFISFHFALRFTINLQFRCALGNVVVFYLASRQQWLRKMLVSALSVVWTPWPTFLARWSLYIVHYTISYIGCGLDALADRNPQHGPVTQGGESSIMQISISHLSRVPTIISGTYLYNIYSVRQIRYIAPLLRTSHYAGNQGASSL